MFRSIAAFSVVLALVFGTALQAGTLEYCDSPAAAIPYDDGSGFLIETDTIDVLEDFVILDTTVLVDITHAFIGDMALGLLSPSGTGVILLPTGVSDTADVLVIFNDAGVAFGDDVFTCGCDMMPSGPGTMSDFDGESTLGLWGFYSIDVFPDLDDGTLNEWCLTFDTCGTVTLGPPTDVTCTTDEEANILVTWTGSDAFESFTILYNNTEELATIGADEDFSFLHEKPGQGLHSYTIFGNYTAKDCGEFASEPCQVVIGKPSEYCVTLTSGNDLGDAFPPLVSTLEVTDALLLEEVHLFVDITHSWIGDVTLDLAGPDATTASIFVDPTDSFGTDMFLTFADGGAPYSPATSTCACFTAPSTAGALDTLVAGGSAGTWTLTAADPIDFDEGTLNAWCLNMYGEPAPPKGPIFLRGDSDGNGTFFALVDALHVLDYGFTDGDDPPCFDAADADGNGVVSALLDALYMLEYQFTDGDLIPAPFPDCGVGEELAGCATSTECP